MSSVARNAKSESKSQTQRAKYVRCGECAYSTPVDDELVYCPHYGKMFKTNSCIRRKRK